MSKGDYIGEFEHLVLLTIARAGGKAGGAQVHADLEAVSKRGASLPAIYVTLARLEKKGLVRASELVPREAGGRPRRLFEITRAGSSAIHGTRAVLERMWTDLPALGRQRR
jgi:PadR family transcriptional regulator, regulatory protein PadR